MSAWDEPQPYQARRLAVIDSIQPAIERTKAMLFGPMVFGIWLRFGAIAFFEQLSRGGGSFNINMGASDGVPDDFGESFEEFLDTALGILADYAPFIIGTIVILFLFAILFRYLSCRAEVMFARGCAVGATSLTMDWRETRSSGNSLFGFHLLLLGLGLVVMILCGLLLYAAVLVRHDFATMLPWLILLGIVVFFATIFFGLADSLTRQFVTPIMVRDNQGWQAAWGKVGPVLLANILPLLGYYLLKMVFWMFAGFIFMIVGCATLCIAFLPGVHQTIFAPVYVFERNWTMVMLHYLGPGFEVFHETEPIDEGPNDEGRRLDPAPWEQT